MKHLTLTTAMVLAMSAGAVSAATYSVDNLINIHADNFGSSMIHEQDYNGDMSGHVVAYFDEAVESGGMWNHDGSINFSGSGWTIGYEDFSYSATGMLSTAGAGFLDFVFTLWDETFEATFHFADADYGGPANGFDGSVISLWGQTGDCHYQDEGLCAGIDLRIAVSEKPGEVPLPASALLLLGGVGAMGAMRAKKRKA